MRLAPTPRTGVFWKPIHNVLEGHAFELVVVNAQHMKAIPGKKTDVKDAEWIADLTESTARAVELICLRLDGIPLAIELAAAWITLLSPTQLLDRLEAGLRFLVGGNRSAPGRHQTIDAAIHWSYDLLSEAEQRLFARVSVFAGGFSLEAAEAVRSNEHVTRDEVVGLLRRLIAKSLVIANPDTHGAMRYRLLEPLRDFGAGVLRDLPDAHAVRDRHGAFYVALVRQSNQVISGGPAAAWNAQLLGEHDNLNAALRWFLETGDVDRAQLAGAALGQIWRRRGTSARVERCWQS